MTPLNTARVYLEQASNALTMVAILINKDQNVYSASVPQRTLLHIIFFSLPVLSDRP